MNQVSTKRVRSVQKHLKIGKRELMEVLRVDHAKGYIDLGKKNRIHDDIQEADKRWKMSKKVHEIMFEVSMKIKVPIKTLYESWGWDLYEKCGFAHALDAFRVANQ